MSTLAEFAAANDAAAATSKKLAKQTALASYFRRLSDQDLVLAVRYASGRAFASTDERVLGISGATVSAVVLDMFELDQGEWYRRLTSSGEFGEALAGLWGERIDPSNPARVDQHRPPLTLGDLQQTWDELAAVGQQDAKRGIVRSLLRRIRSGREAAYIGKIIFSDLRTGVREGVLHAAIAEAFDRDPEPLRRAILLVGDIGEVALLARHDRLGDAKFKLFHPISFMLAAVVETSQEAAETIGKAEEVRRQELEVMSRRPGASMAADAGPPNSELPTSNCYPWLAEHKLDGIRAQIHKRGAGPAGEPRIAIYTRTMDRTDESFPEVVAAAQSLPGDWLLDGEIVPYDDESAAVLPFAILQRRLGRKKVDEGILRRYPCRFVAFDLLFRDGEVLLDQPLQERRAALESLVGNGHGLLLSAVSPVSAVEEIDLAFNEARRARNEGLVIKHPRSPYTPGRRGGAWIKLKTHLPTLDVVVTAAEHGHGKRRNVLSDYTFGVWDRDPAEEGAELVNVGKAYSGVTDAEIDRLTELFLSIQTGRHGHLYTVRPQVVFEVAFDAIQQSDRHASGYAMRFPRIKRIRWDRAPETADQLERVRELFEHEQNFNRSVTAEPESHEERRGDPDQLGLFE